MSEFKEIPVQRSDETHDLGDGASAANVHPKPMMTAPRSFFKKHGRKAVRVASVSLKPRTSMPPTPSQKRSRKAASPAIQPSNPKMSTPGALSLNRDRKIARRSSTLPEPIRSASGENSEGHIHDETHQESALNGRATRETKPTPIAPDLLIRDGQCSSETQGENAVAGDDQLRHETHAPIVIAPLSNRDRKIARRSMAPPKPTTAVSGENSEGHSYFETHLDGALNGRASHVAKPIPGLPDYSFRDGHHHNETQEGAAVAGDDHQRGETQTTTVIATVIDIQEQWRRRQAWHRQEKSLTLAASAICRRAVGARGIHKEMDKSDKAKNKILLRQASEMLERIETNTTIKGDKNEEAAALSCMRILMARDTINEGRKPVEKDLANLARSLPVWPWVKSIYGAAELSLYAVVGECGDVGSYKSVSAVWKRMGLAVIDGQRQRRVTGPDALLHGYSPKRRSVAWNIGGGLIGGMGKGPRPKVGEDIELRDDWSPYQKQFVRLLRQEVERVTDTWNGPEHRRDPVERKGELYESFSSHASNRIKRRIEKQFLAELYGAWRGEIQLLGETHE